MKAKGQSFMRIDGAHGTGKQWSKCKAVDRDPKNGTSDYKKSLEMMGMARRNEGEHGHLKRVDTVTASGTSDRCR